ncbi:MAG: signal peptidase I [Butyrivibrio sp.]|nr:signal peptidase I [Butyrivibrio sp.]
MEMAAFLYVWGFMSLSATDKLIIYDNNGKDSLMMWIRLLIILFIIYMLAFVALDIVREKKAPNSVINNDHLSLNIGDVITELRMLVLRLVIPLILVYVILNHIVFVTYVASGSMEPKLHVGSTAVYSRLAYIRSFPQRGDIICFSSSEYDKTLAKRVVGIPGDTLEFNNGHVFVNGVMADETEYIEENIETYSNKTYTVPDGCVFVLGDNREHSKDSRFWKQPYIPYENIYGKYIGALPFSLRVLPLENGKGR